MRERMLNKGCTYVNFILFHFMCLKDNLYLIVLNPWFSGVSAGQLHLCLKHAVYWNKGRKVYTLVIISKQRKQLSESNQKNIFSDLLLFVFLKPFVACSDGRFVPIMCESQGALMHAANPFIIHKPATGNRVLEDIQYLFIYEFVLLF